MDTIQKKIIKLVRSKNYSPMAAGEIAEYLAAKGEESVEGLLPVLNGLELAGEVVKIKKGQYASPKKLGLIVGQLECKSRGFGFVIPALKEIERDVYVDGESMGSAMDGDVVVVRIPAPRRAKKGRRGRRRKSGKLNDSGKIIDVLRHANESVIGLLKKGTGLNYVVPDNAALFRDIYVADDCLLDAEDDDKVIVRITRWPTRHLNPEGEVVEILGQEDAPGVDIRSAIHQYGLPRDFDETIKEIAANLPLAITRDALTGREDVRSTTVITIDPEDAKDFDDAVSLKYEGGKWFLGVHIADVSYYVKRGSSIDCEAAERGNSIYFPGEVIPMLPEELSNGICSLRENEDKLTKSVFATFDKNGNLLNAEIKSSVIRVNKRFNYDEVTRILEDGNEEDGGGLDPDLHELLLNTKTLAEALYKKRLERGSIELDLPEVDLTLDDNGDVAEVKKRQKDIAHGIIEEFMLIANEAVATFAKKHKLPCFYRVHDEPDPADMHAFAGFVKSLRKIKFNPSDRRELQGVLDEFRCRPEAYAVNLMLLRSFMQAVYSVKQNEHYALAIENYTHFTSPIRRYADLVVHRALDDYFTKKKRPEDDNGGNESLAELASHCSFTERRAEDAERTIIKVKLMRHVEASGKKEFDGVITGVEEYGFFVQIQENLLEGLVHVKTLKDDFYQYSKKEKILKGERSKRAFRIGDKVRIKISKIDRLKKQVDFSVI